MGEMANISETTERLITVEEFDRMWERGIIGPEERLELIEGRLVRREMMNPPHASIVARITATLIRALRIELYRGRHDLGYAPPVIAEKGDDVSFAAFPALVLAVDELVG